MERREEENGRQPSDLVNIETTSSLRKKIAMTGAALLGVVGLGLGLQALENEFPKAHLQTAMDGVSDLGLTPTPDVSSSGTEALITVNDTLRDIGIYVLGGAGIVYGGLQIAKRKNSRLDARFSYARQTEQTTKTRASRFLPPVIIASVAVASGLGDAAGDGANKPLAIVQESIAQGNEVPVIVQHESVIPFNHSSVTKDKIQQTNEEVIAEGLTAVPFMLSLGSLSRAELDGDAPSSAPIIAIPDKYLDGAFNMPEQGSDNSCSNIQVVVGEQLGVGKGDIVTVEGQDATVSDTIQVLPGLDRVVVLGSLEQMEDCVFNGESYWGAVVIGENNLDVAKAVLDTHNEGDYYVTNFEELNSKYSNFWDRSVKPPMMQLILLAFGAGAAGVMYIRNAEILRQKKSIATLVAQGVQKEELIKSENLRGLNSNLRAALYAGPLTIALTGVVNSSQYGLEMSADLRSLGAGFTAFTIIGALGSRGAKRSIRKLDAAAELRSGV